MPDEPNPQMDEMLKAYARARRERAGTPPPLHPATRAMLQGEVARTFKETGKVPETRVSFWESVRGRIVMAGSVCAALLIFGFVFLQFQPQPVRRGDLVEKQSTMADAPPPVTVKLSKKKEQSYARESASRARAPHESSSAGKTIAAEKVLLPSPSAQSAASAPVAMNVAETKEGSYREEEKLQYDLADQKKVTADKEDSLKGGLGGSGKDGYRAMGVAAKADAVSRAFCERKVVTVRKKEKKPTPRIQFRQVAIVPMAGMASPADSGVSPVLRSFEMQQDGSEIRITDADGSTYVGQLDVPPTLPVQKDMGIVAVAPPIQTEVSDSTRAEEKNLAQSKVVAREPALPDVTTTNLQRFFFHVRGHNQSLNQSVEFHGRFVGDPNILQTTTNLPLRALRAGSAPHSPAAQVQGQILIGGTNAVELNAVFVEPK